MESPAIHALLIGIDAYPVKPLRGCVNDIEAVQHRILARVKSPEVQIRRLLSPHPTPARPVLPTDQPATYANIRAELRDLATRIRYGDRVFIYYSGHGLRATFPAGTTSVHREALVPVDFQEHGVLFDHELNGLLAAIVAVTTSVTVALDCCHSAGATRDLGPAVEMVARCLDSSDVNFDGVRAPDAGASGIAHDIDACHVVCGCRDYESSYETTIGGIRNGLLTRAFVDAVDALGDADIRDVPWSRIWYGIADTVERANSAQHVWMSGHPGRTILAGPPVVGDIGIAITGKGPSFELDAGEIAGVTVGTLVGVYPDRPPFLPPLDSQADRELRLGMLRVTDARRARAAAAFERDEHFELPAGARARIVMPATGRLRCALIPGERALEKAVAESPLLEITPTEAQVRVVAHHNSWALVDDAHDREPLVVFPRDPIDARRALEHYARYILPLQIANRATDLPGKLELTLRACPADDLSADAAQTTDLPEIPTRAPGAYEVEEGTRVAIRVRNTSTSQLKVDLVNCAASGKVEMLGHATLDAASSYTFWLGSNLGVPFELSVPDGRTLGVDRLVAIGRTSDDSLAFLRVDDSFATHLARLRSVAAKDMGSRVASPPGDLWTSARILVRTRRAARSN